MEPDPLLPSPIATNSENSPSTASDAVAVPDADPAPETPKVVVESVPPLPTAAPPTEVLRADREACNVRTDITCGFESGEHPPQVLRRVFNWYRQPGSGALLLSVVALIFTAWQSKLLYDQLATMTDQTASMNAQLTLMRAQTKVMVEQNSLVNDQNRSIAEQTRLMNRQTDITTRQFEATDRPWLKIIKVDDPLLQIGPAKNGRPSEMKLLTVRAKIVVRNVGKTVASGVTLHLGSSIGGSEAVLDTKASVRRVCAGKVTGLFTKLTLLPDDEFAYPLYIESDIAELVETEPRTISFEFYGCVSYTFPASTIQHHTDFAFRPEADPMAIPGTVARQVGAIFHGRIGAAPFIVKSPQLRFDHIGEAETAN